MQLSSRIHQDHEIIVAIRVDNFARKLLRATVLKVDHYSGNGTTR